MKKNIAFLFVFFASVALLQAQNDYWHVGIEGGPSRATLRGNSYLEDDHTSRLGMGIGMAAEKELNEHISIRTGLMYEVKGSALEIDAYDDTGYKTGTINSETSFEVLSVPVLFRYRFGKNLKPFVNAGFFGSYLLKAYYEIEPHGEFDGYYEDVTETMKSFDIGLSAGIGATYPLGFHLKLSGEIRHNKGLLNISDVEVIDDGSIKTDATYFLIGLSYIIPIKIEE